MNCYNELDNIIRKLYEDNVNGKLTDKKLILNKKTMSVKTCSLFIF